MKWFEHDQMMYEEGREQGRKDTQESAERERKIAEQERKNAERERQIAEQEKKRAEAAEQKNELTKRLLADQRIDDLQRALDDPAFRDQLLQRIRHELMHRQIASGECEKGAVPAMGLHLLS